ncbi:unnamed protein product [Rotaria sordida]|uniref:Uncharacterized protein n=1 Tax=Rotaria sordida TaxID=392033 RepID=A0A813TQN5_9BILA|nr:unnamed protein product [Rotaria sordida]CAF0817931.1 unnamed protein product [Rotaria sordida]CAF3587292.1 unnamed protein product [Rotaria sordida]CAF3657043.1 unnamed protein product [Rotaria sordida]
MYQQWSPYHYARHYSYVNYDRRQRLSLKEIIWRRLWPRIFTVVLASVMLLLIIIIFSLEVASLASDPSNNLSNTASTGAGIWCSIFFVIPVIFMYLLVSIYHRSRMWSTYTLITHLIALVFICILIGLDANTVTPYNTMGATAPTKIKILRGQLAAAVLMFIFPFSFLAAYIYTAFMSIVSLRSHPRSIHPPFPVSSDFVKY